MHAFIKYTVFVVNRILSRGLKIKLGRLAHPERKSAEARLTEARWQLPFHLGFPVFNWPHYVINLANLPLSLEAHL